MPSKSISPLESVEYAISDLPNIVRRWDRLERIDGTAKLKFVSVRMAFVAAYTEAIESGAAHEEALARANEMQRRVRKLLGLSKCKPLVF